MAFPTSPTDGQVYNSYVYNSTENVWKKDAIPRDELFPIGMLYTQYPGKPDPAELGWPGTWENISTEYAGDFFRVEGGDAEMFGGGQQSDAIRDIKGYFEAYGLGFKTSASATGPFNWEDGSSSDGGAEYSTTRHERRVRFDVSRVVPTASENRPVNQTVRIWEKVPE